MSNRSKPLIFSVDDSADILNLIERYLRGSGYDVVTSESAVKAITLVEKSKPDLILLDVVMPEMDGYEFCTYLQKNSATSFIPVIFLTALRQEQDKARAFAAGGVDYLTKPTTKDNLVAMVEKHLKTKKQWGDLEKGPVPADTKTHNINFKKFVEFMLRRLNLSMETKETLAKMKISQLYSVPAEIGIKNRQVARLVSEFSGLAFISFVDPEDVQLGTLPVPFCVENSVVAVGAESEKPVFVLTNPFKLELMDVLRRYSGRAGDYKVTITEPDNIDLLLRAGSPHAKGDTRMNIAKPTVERGKKEKDDRKRMESEVEDHPIVYIASNILYKAVQERASDIHIEPKDTSTVVRFRVDGDMVDVYTLQKKTSAMLVSRYKVLGDMDIMERRKPQDGAFEAAVGSREFKFRLATTSTAYGESMIIRVLEPSSKPRDLKELGMTEKQVNTMVSFARRHQGFVLVVGATGSGKTTTIYSLISQIDCTSRSLITVEDPVEYTIPFANQQQVNAKGGVTFESLLKSSVRQDPDILYMGEMRDSESARTAVDFASTGHLAISTMHTANSTTAVFRLERLGIGRSVIADAILGVVSQRLLKKLCKHCKKVEHISDEEKEMLAPFTDDVPAKVAHPVGCPQCNETGYLGREGVYEIMEFTPEISDLVRSNASIQEIRNHMKKRGDFLMSDHAVEKVKQLLFPPKDAFEKVLVEDRLLEGKKKSGTKTANEGGKISILVAEDDKDTQKLIARLLENQGYYVTVAGDGIEALLFLGKSEFNLILSDIDMPNLDGLRLLEMKNQKGIETPVIFLTARTGEESELHGFSLGAVDYIKKPIQKDVLLMRIKKALEK